MSAENEKVLYVIGNGFDINLGLKTKYKDYFENFGITQMKEILELFRENEKNIKEFNQEKLEKFIEDLKKYNINFYEDNDFKRNLEESVRKNDKKEIKRNIDTFHKSIFTGLKDENKNIFLEDYGLFIIFLILLKVEKDEWQWVEEQVSDYIKDIIDITKTISEKDINISDIVSNIIENINEIEENIKKYTQIIIKERQFNEKEFYKNNNIKNTEIYDFLIQILKRETDNYLGKIDKCLQDKDEIQKLNTKYRNYTQNINHKIIYIYFSLQIFLNPDIDLEFDSQKLEIKNRNNSFKMSLKEELYRFENYFGNYALKISEYMLNILNKNLEKNVTKNEFIDIEISLKSEIERRLKRIFGFENGDKYIASFNYTTYLKYYIGSSNQNVPIKNLKNLININGNVDDFKIIRKELKYKKKETIREIVSNIKEEIKKLKKEVELECKMTDKLEFIKYLDNIINSQYIEEITEEQKLKNELERITGFGLLYKFEIEEKLKEKLKNILNFDFDNSINTGIIFGIDEIQKDKTYKELEEFFKSNRRSNELKDKIKKLLCEYNFKKIYFYGHSLANADYTFFEDLFKNNIKLDFINKIQTELVFLYERDFFNDENIKSIVKLFYNYYYFSDFKKPKTKDEILDLIFNLRKKGILKIKIRENSEDEYEEQNNILILDNKVKLKELLLKI